MRVGDRIRIKTGWGSLANFTVEEFRYCLGVFQSDQHRIAGDFTPLCDLYEAGAYSELHYLNNFGEHITNKVPRWMDLPRTDEPK